MIIKGFAVTLSRLTIDDIELVRQWRNSETVRQFMEFREEITPEMQIKWFKSIDNEINNYYIIHDGNKKIGLIYGAEIDWEKGITGNGGIFISDESYWNTYFPLSATLLLMEISFILGMKAAYIKVLRDNEKAIQFNTNIGFELMENQNDVVNQQYILTKKSYDLKTEKIRQLIEKVYSNAITIIINDPTHIVSKRALRDYENQSSEVKKRVTMIVDQNISSSNA
jgi:UDP-4-amino-4,6-dideoxy-N-acetyl-beta-L-altrosamine N-acetyltransferase